MQLRQLDLNLFPKVYAQTLDANAQPTFGPLEISTGTGTQASVSLTASSTSVQVGRTIDVDIEIKTGAFTIKEYRLIIEYDLNKLQVVDDQPTVAGTQIKFLDTVFTVDAGNNTVTNSGSTGKITLIARTPTGNALQVNRKVAQIKFQAQSTGNTTVTAVTGVSGTQLINQNGVGIPNTPNNLSLSVVANTGTSTSGAISSSPATSTAATAGTSTGGSTGVGQIPDTAIGDDLVTLLPFIVGVMLVALGTMLSRHRNAQNHPR